MAKHWFLAILRRQSRHMSGDCSLDLAREWSNRMINSDLLWGHGGGVIVLNAITTVFLAIPSQLGASFACRVEDLVNSVQILIELIIGTRLMAIILFFNLFRLRCSDFGLPFIAAPLWSLILPRRRTASRADLTHRSQMMPRWLCCVRMTRYKTLKPSWRLRWTGIRSGRPRRWVVEVFEVLKEVIGYIPLRRVLWRFWRGCRLL